MSGAKTSKNTFVTHECHIKDFSCAKDPLNAGLVVKYKAALGTVFPTAVEVGEPDPEYNCHGFSVVSSHGFFYDPTLFLHDDHDKVPFDQPQIDDVVAYHHGALVAHTAKVIAVSGSQITRVRSKWGKMGLVEHDLRDVRSEFGAPDELYRRKPGLGPQHFLKVELAMGDASEDDKQAVIEAAVANLSDPNEQYKVMLASSPEVAKLIIEGLPGVQELLALGPEAAGRVALDLLNRQENEALSGIALYILQRASHEETAPELASAIRENKFSGINLHLAADALLSAAKFESLTGDPVVTAKALAEDLK
jgi:hypothetical protein